MAARTVIVFLLCSISLLLVAHSFGALTSYSNMAPSSAHEQGSTQDLKIRISSDSSSSVLKVTLENKSPTQTYSVLTWDTPLDPQAMNLGALTLEDVESGDAIPGPGMKINRQMPPPRDAVVEVRPQSSTTRDVNLGLPWIPSDGKVYRIQTQGSWKAVWAKPAAQISDEDLEKMAGDSHLSKDIHSESAEIKLE